MRTRFLSVFVLSMLFFASKAVAQGLRATYPVQVTAFLNPPYSLYLEDFCSGNQDKLTLVLLNRDQQEPFLDVKLHMSIKAGNGIKLETLDQNPYPSIRLDAGIPYKLTNDKLCPYFQPDNLDVQGSLLNGKLPEGMVEICISVQEVHTERILSQTSCARAWVTLNRPPQLSLPLRGTLLPFREPQHLLFQWTPRHQTLSNVEYEFVLKEIGDIQAPLEASFASSPEIYTTILRSTSLAYTVLHPPLLENKRYAWQVRALIRSGFEESNVFENQGYSELYSFDVQEGCNAPTEVNHLQDMSHLVVKWTPQATASGSVVAYRSKAVQGDWRVVQGNNDYLNLQDLQVGLEYEYKVGTVCSDGSIVYSPLYTAVLEDWKEEIIASCGEIPSLDHSNPNPLKQLNPGDLFMAGDFQIIVSKAEGINGIFSGLGWTKLPMIAYAKIAVQFNKITINEKRQMTSGFVETAYDKYESQIADGDQLWHGGNQTGSTKTGAVGSDVKVNFSIPEGSSFTYDKANGSLEVKDKDGNEVGSVKLPEEVQKKFESQGPATCIIEDKDGNIYTVTKDENDKTSATQIGKKENPIAQGSFSETELDSKKAVVEFMPAPDADYAFDKWKDYYKDIALIAGKGTYEHLGAYEVPCKLIPAGESDKVAVKVNIVDKKNIKEDSILYKTKTGYTVRPEGGLLTLAAGKANDAQDLFALYPKGDGSYYTLGKLKIVSYPQTTHQLVLVPVKGNTLNASEVENYLNEVYGKAAITWEVTQDSNFTYPSDELHSEGSDLFTSYSDEMKALNSAYKSQRPTDKKTVYLFILRKGNIREKQIAGDMPRGKQFGYLFTEEADNILWTIAHELGHGKFKLRHTFDEEYGVEERKGSMDNLMDYSNPKSTHLAKWQWDEIHDPALFVNPFEGDEDGMSLVINDRILFQSIEEIRRSIHYGEEIQLVVGMTLTEGKKKIEIGNASFNFITIKMSKNTKLSLEGSEPVLFSERNLFRKEQYGIGYSNQALKIIVQTQKERDLLHAYLHEKRSNSQLLFVGGYNLKLEIAEFINKNEDLRKEYLSKVLDPIFGFLPLSPTSTDANDYWDRHFVDQMVSRLKPRQTTYIMGHDDVGTSNHRNMAAFVNSLISSNKAENSAFSSIPIVKDCYHNNACVKLNTTPNPSGFKERYNKGRLLGSDYVKTLVNKCTKEKGQVIDSLDIVCHSMGFATALGIIDVVKQAMNLELKGLKFGRLYIFAPENPSSGSVNLSDWEEVWQYGSDENTLKDQLWRQDGVAPQCPIDGIKNRRAFIPDNVEQGFLNSHYISNYGWVFKRDQDQDGHITPRK